MEWGAKAAAAAEAEERGGGCEPLGYVKVMTDEQMEVLRKQISIYATICEQLVEMHRALTEHQDSIAGMRFSNLYCDPLIVPGGHKITARQRWQPTPMQLQILENIFDQGNGTPSKQKIKEITAELSHHGQISETNVYNWISEMHQLQRDQMGGMMYGSNDNNMRTSGTSGQMSFYDNIMSNPRIDHFPGKVESSRSFSHLQHGEGFDMFG
ncbi:hypothetical protein PR202_ga09236 [Eleusine coracana subsp. coracana]|uniref:Homeobox domain-containing protein n=1 Tax=Eleusine coracana subsp. coracana TaxID=191504 RepID=A0AAV5C4L3_ELECO|nr:hypothetical protein PR202_ga09236 [Eleusine coracana subsp. coracana]